VHDQPPHLPPSQTRQQSIPSPPSPTYQPTSPSLSSVPSLPRNLPDPSTFQFHVPPISRLPRSANQFPQPPPITPLTGDEPPLEAETPEALLESALWSWYTAGSSPCLSFLPSSGSPFPVLRSFRVSPLRPHSSILACLQRRNTDNIHLSFLSFLSFPRYSVHLHRNRLPNCPLPRRCWSRQVQERGRRRRAAAAVGTSKRCPSLHRFNSSSSSKSEDTLSASYPAVLSAKTPSVHCRWAAQALWGEAREGEAHVS
jgi:hypothetical protein